MLLRAKDNNIQSFAYTWLHKGNQNEFLKQIKLLKHLKHADSYLPLEEQVNSCGLDGESSRDDRLSFKQMKEAVKLVDGQPILARSLSVQTGRIYLFLQRKIRICLLS